MEFSYKDAGIAIIIYVHGMLDLQRSAKIDSGLEQLISSGPGRDFIFNLKDMEYSSSAGHGIFINILGILNKSGRRLVFCNLNEQVRRVFEIVELDELFAIFDSEEEALDYLESSKEI
ncbi:MAG TPA: STAS domain-containing protein [Spirochaetota bacterium]|nr:STAS domain-containing protein [Spirochaetota bacterium]HPR39008.1 STAS domain-containing protein [Spirochaetota bacterium]